MADNACGVAAIFCCVSGINLFIDVSVGLFHKGNIFVHATSANVSFMASLNATEPGGIASIHRSEIEIVSEADDPNRHQVSQCTISSE